jgi:hypothetical protein
VLPEEEKAKTARLSRGQSGAEPGRRKQGAEKASKKNRESEGLTSSQKAEEIVQAPEQPKEEMPPPPPPKGVPKRPAKIPREPKLNPDAKRPASIRDHKLNGAYLVWKIMQDLRRITGESPFQPVAPSPNPTAAMPKPKPPRKSAPAALALQDTVRGVAVVHATPMRQGHATALASSPLPDTLPAKSGDGPIFDSDRSISVGVKTRKRKQTVSWRMVRGVETRVSISDMDVPETRKPEATSVLCSPATPSLPYNPAILRPSVPKSRRLPPPTPTTPQQPLEYHEQGHVPHPQPSHIPHPQNYTSHPHNHFHPPPPRISNPSTPALDAIDAGFRETDRLIAQLSRPTTPVPLRLAPLKTLPQFQQQQHLQREATHQCHEPRQSLQEQRQPKLAPLEPKVFSPGPRNGISSDVGSPLSLRPGSSNPFFFTDPLVGQLGYPPLWLKEEWGEREQCSPPREGQQVREGHWPHGQHQGQQQNSPHPGSTPVNRQDSWSGLGPRQQQQPQQGHQAMGYAQQPRTGNDGWRASTGRSSEESKLQLQGGQQVERTSAPVSPWCPDEQLRKEQEAALMLSAMSGRSGYYQG